MRHRLLTVGLSLLVASTSAPALAVQPVGGEPRNWSQVITDPFDGMLVYDRHFDPDGDFSFITSWSRQSIRATYTWTTRRLTGYRTVWRTRSYTDSRGRRRTESYPEQEPIYQVDSHRRIPKALMFSIEGQVYTYEEGPVPAELAIALFSAPPGNMTIRVVWDDGETRDFPVGRRTVEAWRQIFAEPTPQPQ